MVCESASLSASPPVRQPVRQSASLAAPLVGLQRLQLRTKSAREVLHFSRRSVIPRSRIELHQTVP